MNPDVGVLRKCRKRLAASLAYDLYLEVALRALSWLAYIDMHSLASKLSNIRVTDGAGLAVSQRYV